MWWVNQSLGCFLWKWAGLDDRDTWCNFYSYFEVNLDLDWMIKTLCAISLNILSHILLLENFHGGSSYPSVQCQQCCIFLVRSLLMLYTHCQWPYCIYSCKDKSVLYNMENPFCVILINMFCIVWLNLFCIICRVRFLYDVDEFVLYNMDESNICIIWINTPWGMFSIKYGKSAMYTTEESAICIIWIYIIG